MKKQNTFSPPNIEAYNVADKRWGLLSFSYTILSVEDDTMQHTIQFGIHPIVITIDGTPMPSINFSIGIWKFRMNFGMGKVFYG